MGRPKFSMGGRFVKLSLPARGFSDSTVDCEIRLDYSGRVCDLGEEVCWKVGQRQLASSPPPPWVHQVNVCARVVHLKYMPKKSSPRLSRDSAVSEGAKDP